MNKRNLFICLFFFLLLTFSQTRAEAATPLIRDIQPCDCYYHYDGKIWVYSNSSYKAIIKAAIKKLNKKYHVFQWTTDKTSSDVIIADKKKGKGLYGKTRTDLGKIILYRNTMKRLSKTKQILVVEHELCHAAGIDHARDKKSLMYKTPVRTKGLTSADLKALKKARKRALKTLSGRKKLYKSFLAAEEGNEAILVDTSRGDSDVLVFPKRGTSYHSSNTAVLKVRRNGLMTARKKGTTILTVQNAGIRHTFTIKVK